MKFRTEATWKMHSFFINRLGPHRLKLHTDGGATDDKREERRKKGKAQRQARKRQRRK